MIQQTDLERFKELLSATHIKDGQHFKTNEISISSDCISIWDEDRSQWYYLNKNLEWERDLEDEDLFRF